MSKRAKEERKKFRKEHNPQQQKPWNVPIPLKQHLTLREIEPLNTSQRRVFDEYDRGKHLVLHGFPGTGKTFIALFLALEELLEDQRHHKIIIVKSMVPQRDAGFLPGSIKEKGEAYEAPYHQICTSLFGRGDAYSLLKQKGHIEFITTSYIRGITLDDAIVIVEEYQNCVDNELNAVITRLGNNSRLILCGDITQNDLKRNEKTAVATYMKIFEKMPSFSLVEFGVGDVVRSGTVKEYLLTRYKLEEQGNIPSLAAAI